MKKLSKKQLKEREEQRRVRFEVLHEMLTPTDIRCAFQSVAEAIGGDVMQVCREMGEPERVDRDGCYDYLEMYGGPYGKLVQEWVMLYPPDGDKDYIPLEACLNLYGVPKYWV